MTAEQRRLLRDEIDAVRRGWARRFVPNGLCTYCGGEARKNSLACTGHSDLLRVDPLIRGIA